MKLFTNFLKLIGIGMISSLFPFLHIGLFFGFPSVVLAAVFICIFFNKELS